jgi:hypothetical protein
MLAKPATPYVAELLDAQDVSRRLALVRVRDIMRASDGVVGSAAAVDANATVRAALGAILAANGTLDVRDGERVVGTIDLAAVRAALAA